MMAAAVCEASPAAGRRAMCRVLGVLQDWWHGMLLLLQLVLRLLVMLQCE